MTCFVCLSKVGRDFNSEVDNQSGFDLYKNLIQFATTHLKIFGFENQNDREHDRQVFCTPCEKVVGDVRQLHLELLQAQLRLSSKLGELGELFESAGIGDAGHLQDFRELLRLKCKQKGLESFPEVAIARQPPEIKEEIIDEAPDYRESEDEGDDSDSDDEMGGVNEPKSDDSDPEFICPDSPAADEEVTVRKKRRKREVKAETDEEVAEFEDNGKADEVTCFQCCFCWMSFENSSSLKSHVGLKHTCGNAKETFQKGAFTCEEEGCGQRFQSHLQLNSHLKTHAPGIYVCPICQLGFLDANLLKLHQLVHITPVKRPESRAYWRKCPDCELEVSTVVRLQSHYNMRHGAQLKRFKCEECEHIATSAKALSAHERTVHLGQVYKRRAPGASGEVLKRKRSVEDVEKSEDEAESCQCCFCWMTFQSPSSLESHVALVHVHAARGAKETFQKGAFQCEEGNCTLRFQSRLTLNSHLATHSQPIHFCALCDWGFIDSNLLKLHELVHIKPFKNGKSGILWRACPEPDCKKECPTITKLQTHYNMKHGAQLKRFKCEECGHTATSKVGLAVHERVAHLGQPRKDRPPPKNPKQPQQPSLLQCEVEGCPEQFSCYLELNSHLQSHSETINYCKNCGFGFIDVNLLKLHELVHISPSVKRGKKKLRLCPEPGCTFGIESVSGLQGHYNIKHGVSLKRHKCSECDHHSTSESTLRTHIKFMHTDAKRVNYNPAEKKCADCGLEFDTPGQQGAHRRHHHVRSPCPICKQVFIGRIKLRRHISTTHSKNEWKFKCETCSKLYATKERLDCHKKNSHSGQIFNCVECKKTFKTKVGFKEHNNAVHSPNVNICPQCGRTFPSLHYLRNHISGAHKEKGETDKERPYCSAVFPEKKFLLRHIRKDHSNAEENLECAVCGFKMEKGRKQAMKNHMLTHMSRDELRAEGSLHMCYVCGKEFLTKDTHNKHFAIHHKNYHNPMKGIKGRAGPD